MSENKGIGIMNHYASDVSWTQPPSPFASEDALRAFVKQIVRKTLEEDARAIRENKAFQPVDTREHRRVEMTEESGKQWRGVLYRVDDAATDPEIPAVVPPEQREHRG